MFYVNLQFIELVITFLFSSLKIIIYIFLQIFSLSVFLLFK